MKGRAQVLRPVRAGLEAGTAVPVGAREESAAPASSGT